MQRFILCLLLLLDGCATAPVKPLNFNLADLPQDPNGFTYKLEPFIPAAMSLQALGTEAGGQTLLRAAKTAGFDDYEKVVVLCRMLFTFRGDVDQTHPSLGHRGFFGGTTIADWPLEPIELVDGYPFWIVEGLSFFGDRSPDAASRYVSYCIKNCEWSTFRYRELSSRERRAALAKLLRSPKWKRPLTPQERSVLSSQIQ